MKNGWAILLLCLTIEYTIAVLLETLLTGAFSTKKGVSINNIPYCYKWFVSIYI